MLESTYEKFKVLGYVRPAEVFHTLDEWEQIVLELIDLQSGGLDTRAGEISCKHASFCSTEDFDRLGFPKDKRNESFYRGVGNQDNHNTGYKGRTAIHEILEVNTAMKQLIFEDANQNQIKEAAKQAGMTTLRQAGIEKILEGKTDINEVLRATVEDS